MVDDQREDGSEIAQRLVGTLYVALGVFGILLNLTTVTMIVTRRVYRLSAYTIMANVALADALMMIVIGVACGATIIFGPSFSLFAPSAPPSATDAILPAEVASADERLSPDVWLPSKRALPEGDFEMSKSVVNHHANLLCGNGGKFLNWECQPISHRSNITFANVLIYNSSTVTNFRKKRRRRRSYWQLSHNFAERRRAKTAKNSNNNNNNNNNNNINNRNNDNNRRSVNSKPSSTRRGGFGWLEKRNTQLNSAITANISVNEHGGTVNERSGGPQEEELGTFRLFSERLRRSLLPLLNWNGVDGSQQREITEHSEPFQSFISFVEIAAWTAGVLSYAFLGLNRCVAICYYGTKAKYFNRVSVAIVSSAFTWIVGIGAACVGTFPTPLVQSQPNVWSLSFVMIDGNRSLIFMFLSLSIYTISVILQWICSTLVLIKIHQIWMGNHLCNPFIYAYFNERMRLSYREFLTCARLRLAIMKRRRRNLFKKRGTSRRSAAHQRVTQQMSTRSAGAASCKSNGNFVRNSLQMQSRDFEQLCEFMMRVNPLYDSSEGWRETSSTNPGTPCADYGVTLKGKKMEANSDGYRVVNHFSFHGGRAGGSKSALESRAYGEALANGVGQRFRRHRHERENRSSRSIVLDLGRQTVEHWATFAKKASI